VSGWMWFVLGILALVIADHAIANVCNSFRRSR
jgi:hypothetical protein